MKRVVVVKLRGRSIHLLRIVGILVVSGAFLGALSSLASVLLLVKQIGLAQADPSIALDVFGLTSSKIGPAIVIGKFLGPAASIILWLALMFVGIIIYRSGGLFLPIEEEITEEQK